jgi:pimeloyl-ACP methyl ester carboxylesterase
LAASQLWQLVAPDGREVGPHQRSVTLPRQTAAGPVAGAPVRLAYREIGSGPPAVYLHGSPGSGRDARRLAARLADEFRLIAPDLPGFGSSSRWTSWASTGST